MKSFFLSVTFIWCVAFVSGCNTRNAQNVQQISIAEVTFLVPPNLSVTKTEEIDNGAVFEIEGLWGELRNHRLIVMGNDYGKLSEGDEVEFKSDGTFLVNGSVAKSLGLGDSAVAFAGVVFFFPGQTVTYLANQDGNHAVEMPDGTTYELTKGGIKIDGHEYGPYAPKTVVKVADGSVAFNP